MRSNPPKSTPVDFKDLNGLWGSIAKSNEILKQVNTNSKWQSEVLQSPTSPRRMVQYTIQFRAERGDIPPTTRMRRLLKFALRSCGFRCVTITRGKDDGMDGTTRQEANATPNTSGTRSR